MTVQGGTQGKSEVKRQEVVKNIKCCSQIKKNASVEQCGHFLTDLLISCGKER